MSQSSSLSYPNPLSRLCDITSGFLYLHQLSSWPRSEEPRYQTTAFPRERDKIPTTLSSSLPLMCCALYNSTVLNISGHVSWLCQCRLVLSYQFSNPIRSCTIIADTVSPHIFYYISFFTISFPSLIVSNSHLYSVIYLFCIWFQIF